MTSQLRLVSVVSRWRNLQPNGPWNTTSVSLTTTSGSFSAGTAQGRGMGCVAGSTLTGGRACASAMLPRLLADVGRVVRCFAPGASATLVLDGMVYYDYPAGHVTMEIWELGVTVRCCGSARWRSVAL